MNILIRADASIEIGTGHIMRCLTLAHLLKEKGAKVTFVCAETNGNMIDYISRDGFDVCTISAGNTEYDAEETTAILQKKNSELLILDHYKMDINWERIVREKFENLKMMVIDDLANRKHDCDILLDQNYLKDYKRRYDELVPSYCRKLLGPKYLLLRPEFYRHKRVEKKSIKDILVFYGGSDPTNETVKALEALEVLLVSDVNIHVVVGQTNKKKEIIQKMCQENGYYFYLQIDYLADIMRQADLALGAGGVTMWERCFLGLPSIVTVVADNQRDSTEAAANFGAVWNLGWHKGVKVSDLVDIIRRTITQPNELKEMSKRARMLMESERNGETHPVVEAIMEVLNR